MMLFYSPGTCSLAEMILLQWLGTPHRLCRVTRDERKGDAYRRAVNPHGQVPVLLEDGRLLTENAAILLLLADRAPTAAMVPPSGSPERYDVYRWLSWLDSGFHSAHSPAFAPQRFHPDPEQHDVVRTHAREAVSPQLAVLDEHLEGREHVLLVRRNILDAYVFAMARWSEESHDHVHRFPNLARFMASMRLDEGVQTALRIEAGEAQAGGSVAGHITWDQALNPSGSLRDDLGHC